VEIILARGFVSNLATPAFLVGVDGTLVFYNEAAAELLGVRFEEAGSMAAEEWATKFDPVGTHGEDVPLGELPLGIALIEGRPAHRALRIRAASGEQRTIEATAFPIVGHEGRSGAIAIFWSDES
jgi:PAS domain-containing protein